jgi:hypothetical protein
MPGSLGGATRGPGRVLGARSRALVVISGEAIIGLYDVIARAQTENVDVLGKLVVSRIHLVGGITRTLTCPIVHL